MSLLTFHSFDQILGTFLLFLVVASVTDPKTPHIPSSLVPVFIGATVGTIGLSLGVNAG